MTIFNPNLISLTLQQQSSTAESPENIKIYENKYHISGNIENRQTKTSRVFVFYCFSSIPFLVRKKYFQL